MRDDEEREFQVRAGSRALWRRIQTAPRDLLDDVVFPGIGIRRVQVVFDPSFEPGFAWDIRHLDADGWWRFRGRIALRTETDDWQPTRLLGYEPLDVPGEGLRSDLDRMRSPSLPIGPLFNDRGGLDGTNFHLALFGDLHSEVRFRWWTDPPPHWAPLIAAANEMIERFLELEPRRLDLPDA